MTDGLTDATGATITVTLDTSGPIGNYAVHVDDGPAVGRADFIDATGDGAERIFFHTEVDAAYGGRGLAGALVRYALADSIRLDLTVVPVCPLFAGHLKKHGDAFLAEGGRLRRPRRADMERVERTAADSA